MICLSYKLCIFPIQCRRYTSCVFLLVVNIIWCQYIFTPDICPPGRFSSSTSPVFDRGPLSIILYLFILSWQSLGRQQANTFHTWDTRLPEPAMYTVSDPSSSSSSLPLPPPPPQCGSERSRRLQGPVGGLRRLCEERGRRDVVKTAAPTANVSPAKRCRAPLTLLF